MKAGMTKQPKKTRGFSWRRGYSADSHVTGWRLYRWDCHGKLHGQEFYAMPEASREEAARLLRAACHQLREEVDDVELRALGVIE